VCPRRMCDHLLVATCREGEASQRARARMYPTPLELTASHDKYNSQQCTTPGAWPTVTNDPDILHNTEHRTTDINMTLVLFYRWRMCGHV
jgi:hypothetical protein